MDSLVCISNDFCIGLLPNQYGGLVKSIRTDFRDEALTVTALSALH
jgi:hypothetical protein